MRLIYVMFIGMTLLGCSEAPSLSNIDLNVNLEPDTISLLFAGDIMCHKPQVRSAWQDSTYDFNPWFEYVRPIISKADIAFANLETTLSSSGPYSGYPRFKSPDPLADAIKKAGFDVIVTSNNHTNDTGPKGVSHTIDVLKSLGFHQTGSFQNQLERDLHYPLVFQMSGLRIALLNYTYDTNGIPTREPSVVNLIDTILIKEDIARARKTASDVTIAFMHWGSEYHPNPSRKQKRIAQMMIREGVDHIVGAHPHVVQPAEIITDSNGQHLVAYSLGNFISNQKKHLTDGGTMLEMNIIKDKNGTRLGEWNYVPVWRYIRKDSGRSSYEILPMDLYDNDTAHFHDERSFQKMSQYHQYLKKHLSLP